MDRKKIKSYVTSKKGISFLSQVFTLVLVFCLFIIGDYLKFGGTMEFCTDVVYWVTTTISLLLVITSMVTIRAMRKEKLIANDKSIQDNLLTADATRRVVLANAYSEKLQAHIEKENETNKYEHFIAKVTKKINRLQSLWAFVLKASYKERKLKEYEKQLETPKEEVLKMNFKYHKITQTSLFAGIDGKITVLNRFDTSTHELKDKATMISYKAVITYILTMIGGTMIVDFMWNGWSAIWSTTIKLFALALSTNSAIKTAENFVEYNVRQALDNRIRVITNFVNSDNELKSLVIAKKTELLKENELKEEQN